MKLLRALGKNQINYFPPALYVRTQDFFAHLCVERVMTVLMTRDHLFLSRKKELKGLLIRTAHIDGMSIRVLSPHIYHLWTMKKRRKGKTDGVSLPAQFYDADVVRR